MICSRTSNILCIASTRKTPILIHFHKRINGASFISSALRIMMNRRWWRGTKYFNKFGIKMVNRFVYNLLPLTSMCAHQSPSCWCVIGHICIHTLSLHFLLHPRDQIDTFFTPVIPFAFSLAMETEVCELLNAELQLCTKSALMCHQRWTMHMALL